jgi:hypothetical protein
MKYVKLACVVVGPGLIALGHSGMVGGWGQLLGEFGAFVLGLPVVIDKAMGGKS